MHCVSVWRLRAKSQARLPFANAGARRKTLEMSKREVLLALGAAGLVNMPMSAMAAVAFHNGAHHQTAEIETAYWTLAPLLGGDCQPPTRRSRQPISVAGALRACGGSCCGRGGPETEESGPLLRCGGCGRE